jgi:hypothetical protein
MVISQKIIEKEMGYRGSKSVADLYIPTKHHKSVIVKEQRVDGSWCNNLLLRLRCTLMGFERSYQFGILSNQINKAKYSTLAFLPKLNPWWTTGFADAEGSFSILIQHNTKFNTNWRVKAIFSIGLHIKDLAILESIQQTLGVGKIHKHGKESVQFRVESIKELRVIIDHFDRYPLISVKLADYLLFKQCYNLIILKEHLTRDGLLKLVEIKASLNLGLPQDLQKAFPEAIPVTRPSYSFSGIRDPQWLSGFASGDGSFGIKVASSDTTKIGKRVQLRFSIGLHIRELELIKGIAAYLNLGSTDSKYVYLTEDSVNLQVINVSDIHKVVIPFFVKYPILGVKSLDFSDFCEVARILEAKNHLTQEGFNRILVIKAGMNRKRS